MVFIGPLRRATDVVLKGPRHRDGVRHSPGLLPKRALSLGGRNKIPGLTVHVFLSPLWLTLTNNVR